ncbi:MAG TPA: ribonuclease HIII [candidate division Zixibacteria bacterium]|nr:ribonuclease HIII [candidate division Zixibacteria bacterium]
MSEPRRIIGVDESGKGDFFGPLVVAAFGGDQSARKLLAEAGVRDSKSVADNRLLKIDAYLRQNFEFEVVVVMPEEYNQLYDRIRNLNKLLAEGHAEVIDRLHRRWRADMAISDKFGKTELVEDALDRRECDVNLKQMVRGEAVPEVAAASIIARAEFIMRLKTLSQEYGIEIPKGAAPKVDSAGREIVRLFGPEVLPKLAKLHFKNYQRVVNPTLF